MDQPPPHAPADASGVGMPDGDYIQVDPQDIVPDPEIGNIRHHLDDEETEDLAESVRDSGVLQPIAVRVIEGESGPILALVWGSRRLAAVRRAGISPITVRNLGAISRAEALLLQMIENRDRRAMHPVDEALALLEAVELCGSQAAVARRLRVSEATVSLYRRAGEAIRLIPEEHRTALYRSPRIQTQLFRDLVTNLNSSEAIAARLLEIAEGTKSRKPKAGGRRAKGHRGEKPSPFSLETPRRGGGEVAVFRWRDRDLIENPDLVSKAAEFFLDRMRVLVERARALKVEWPRQEPQRAPRSQKDEPAAYVSQPEFDQILDDFDRRLSEIRARTNAYLEQQRTRGRRLDKPPNE